MKRFFTKGSNATQKLLLTLAVMFSFILPLAAQVPISALEIEKWLGFETDEEFTIEGSRYYLEDISTNKYYENVPAFLKKRNESTNSLGVKVSWDRRGSHYVDIVPSTKKAFSGIVNEISMWIWGGDYRHEVVGMFKDSRGNMIGAKFGDLRYYGWKKRIANVPPVVSKKRGISAERYYFFDRIRVVSHPREKVNNIYVFLDKLDAYVQFNEVAGFDGDDLEVIVREELEESFAGGDGENNGSVENNADEPATN